MTVDAKIESNMRIFKEFHLLVLFVFLSEIVSKALAQGSFVCSLFLFSRCF